MVVTFATFAFIFAAPKSFLIAPNFIRRTIKFRTHAPSNVIKIRHFYVSVLALTFIRSMIWLGSNATAPHAPVFNQTMIWGRTIFSKKNQASLHQRPYNVPLIHRNHGIRRQLVFGLKIKDFGLKASKYSSSSKKVKNMDLTWMSNYFPESSRSDMSKK